MIVFVQLAKTKHTILILEPLTSGKPMVVGMQASQTWHTPLDQGIRGRFLFFVSHFVQDDPHETQMLEGNGIPRIF
jgi:hypothetical protein